MPTYKIHAGRALDEIVAEDHRGSLVAGVLGGWSAQRVHQLLYGR